MLFGASTDVLVFRMGHQLLDYFNIGERDIVMFLFFAAVLAAIVIYTAVSSVVEKVRANDSLKVDAEYVFKVMLIPLLCMVLLWRGLSVEARRKAVKSFLYA